MPDKQLVCDKCHKYCEEVLNLRLGKNNDWLGSKMAREKGREPGYYDGMVDGLREAISALRQETGLYWERIRRELAKHAEKPVDK